RHAEDPREDRRGIRRARRRATRRARREGDPRDRGSDLPRHGRAHRAPDPDRGRVRRARAPVRHERPRRESLAVTPDILAPGGGLEHAIPHYEDRAEQRLMSAAVARALDDQRALVVEAGTGTGKTLAYLVPALASGKRVVVSTGTRALQDQIAR